VKRGRGFTLLEVMIVCVIVGILAAIVLPSYQAQLRKSRRASAQSHLMDIASRQQQYLLDNRQYASTLSALGMTTPNDVLQYYTISACDTSATPVACVPSGTPPVFVVTATPIGAQAQDLSGSALSIDSTGAKLPTTGW
jgi:type IV pilus assembly protein PilE